MNIFVCSDLHLDTLACSINSVVFPRNADMIIIAGDLTNGFKSDYVDWLLGATIGVPVFLVLGNHDYYRSSREGTVAAYESY